MNAQERGAVGTIIYSDPQQDGFKRGSTYPDGGWRPSSSVQRGSCQFNSLCAGDPSRAANPRSVENICGFSKEELVPAIPVMPISVRGGGSRGDFWGVGPDASESGVFFGTAAVLVVTAVLTGICCSTEISHVLFCLNSLVKRTGRSIKRPPLPPSTRPTPNRNDVT